MNVYNQDCVRNLEEEAFALVEPIVDTPENINQNGVLSTPESSQNGFHDANGLQETNFMKLKLVFQNKLDRLASPTMCYICQEGYIGITISRTPQGPICTRCKQKKGIHRFSIENSMDLEAQPIDLANLTQVEEILIVYVSPILQVIHATCGQLKYIGHTIGF